MSKLLDIIGEKYDGEISAITNEEIRDCAEELNDQWRRGHDDDDERGIITEGEIEQAIIERDNY